MWKVLDQKFQTKEQAEEFCRLNNISKESIVSIRDNAQISVNNGTIRRNLPPNPFVDKG